MKAILKFGVFFLISGFLFMTIGLLVQKGILQLSSSGAPVILTGFLIAAFGLVNILFAKNDSIFPFPKE